MLQLPSQKRFVESSEWISKMLPHVDFEAEEMSYKRDFAERMAGVRSRVLKQDESWPDAFVNAFPGSNLLNWRYVEELIRFARSAPNQLQVLLERLWNGDVTPATFNHVVVELRRFSGTFGPGVGTAAVSALMMARGAGEFPPFRPEAVHRFWRVVGWPPPNRDATPWVTYQHFRKSLDRFRAVANQSGLAVEDLLTAQGYMWMIVEWDPRTLLPGSDVSRFRAWRGDSTGAVEEAPEPAAARREVIQKVLARAEPFYTVDELTQLVSTDVRVSQFEERADSSVPPGFDQLLSLQMTDELHTLDDRGFARIPRSRPNLRHVKDQALLNALESRVDLLILSQLNEDEYQVICPVKVHRYVHRDKEFELDFRSAYKREQSISPFTVNERRWVSSSAWRRVHQPRFRREVLRAYENQCAVCGLNIPELLDAAHILPDRHEQGIASVVNGLALCRLHHAAYDAGLIGVTEELQVIVARKVMERGRNTGVEHQLIRHHKQPLMIVPALPSWKPSPVLLRQSIQLADIEVE